MDQRSIFRRITQFCTGLVTVWYITISLGETLNLTVPGSTDFRGAGPPFLISNEAIISIAELRSALTRNPKLVQFGYEIDRRLMVHTSCYFAIAALAIAGCGTS